MTNTSSKVSLTISILAIQFENFDTHTHRYWSFPFGENSIETRIVILIMTAEQSTPKRCPYHHRQSSNHYDGNSRSFWSQIADTDKSTTYRTNHRDDYILTILIYSYLADVYSRAPSNTAFSITYIKVQIVSIRFCRLSIQIYANRCIWS